MRHAQTLQWKSPSALAFLLLLGGAGCSSVLPPPEPPPHKGAVVRVGCPEPLAELVRSQSLAWQSRQQARVEVRAFPAGGADVWVLPPAELPRWAASGKLLPVPEGLRERGGAFDWAGLLPVYREHLLTWGPPAWGLPLLGEAPVCLYRADWLASPEHEKKFRAWDDKRRAGTDEPPCRFRPPDTWEEFAAL